MTIQRQYSLPNCKLIVEGLESGASPNATGRPVVAIVTNAECHFVGYEKPLSGGREFLESLANEVSGYAQEYLSAVPHTHPHSGASKPVHLQRIDTDLHRLTVHGSGSTGLNGDNGAGFQMDLKTVQLFDLVEAIDQLYADTQTLPDLALSLTPVSKRHAVTREPIAKQVVPIAVGLSGLAAAAIALFFIPIPERRPEAAASDNSPITTATGSPSPNATGSPSPNPTASASPVASTTSASPSATPEEEASASPTPDGESSRDEGSGEPPNSEQLTEILKTAPTISDPDTINRLKRSLRSKIAESWTQDFDFEEELVYRVGVAEDGEILGFKYTDQASIDYASQTPLLDLRYNSIDPDKPEPIAEFRVVFTPEGAVQVSPWHGMPPSQ